MILKNPINSKDHFRGSLLAPVSIVLYGDYECSICAKNLPWINEILKEFENSVVFAFRHFPLTYIHPHSAIAAVAAQAASSYGKFWQMHSLLLKNHSNLSGETILYLGSQLGIDPDKFMLDLEKDEYMNGIINDMMEAEESGVETAPTFFLNGTKLTGIVNYDSLKKDIEHLLRERQVHF